MIKKMLLACLPLSIFTLQAWGPIDSIQREMVTKMLQKEAILEHAPEVCSKASFFDLKSMAKTELANSADLVEQIKKNKENVSSCTEQEALSLLLDNETALVALKQTLIVECSKRESRLQQFSFYTAFFALICSSLGGQKRSLPAILMASASLASSAALLLQSQNIANIADGAPESINNSNQLIKLIKTKLGKFNEQPEPTTTSEPMKESNGQ